MLKLYCWSLGLCVLAILFDLLGDSAGPAGLGLVLVLWPVLMLSNLAILLGGNFVIYSTPYVIAFLVDGTWKIRATRAFRFALFTTLFTAFGLPFFLNFQISTAVEKARSSDARGTLPVASGVHSISFGGECMNSCFDFLLSRRFDHFTKISDVVTPQIAMDPDLSIPSGSEYSLSTGEACTVRDPSLDRVVEKSVFRQAGDCILSEKTNIIRDDVVIFKSRWQSGVRPPGAGSALAPDSTMGIDGVERHFVGVNKGTRDGPDYEWTIDTEVRYHKVVPVFLVILNSNSFAPTIFVEHDVGLNPELQKYVRSLTSPPSSL